MVHQDAREIEKDATKEVSASNGVVIVSIVVGTIRDLPFSKPSIISLVETDPCPHFVLDPFRSIEPIRSVFDPDRNGMGSERDLKGVDETN